LAEDRYSEYEKKPQRRDWLAVLALLLAVAGGVAYFWKFGQGARGEELLRFTSLFVACPLSLAVIFLFAWLKYPK
jgi:hypothetical protein